MYKNDETSFKQVIEQITQLEWDDDLTYAKFMTALSKSIGNGITRYCDLLDIMFAREMDRMTPEQLAAANATRQERWVQLAKDTWNQEEKYWWQRSRVKWLEVGDRNMRFFHSSTVQRRARNKEVRLKGEGGIWLEREEEINAAFSDFYNKLFAFGHAVV